MLEATARRIFSLFGFREIRTPLFESTDLFSRGIGGGTDIVDKEMYTFADRKGRSLTLRPEGTAGVVRAAIEHNLLQEGKAPRLYYIGPMFRYERPQAGRYRQHWQIGVEAFGASGAALDAEVIHLCMELLSAFGLPGLRARINSIGCPDCRPIYRERLKTHIGTRLGAMCPDCVRRFEINPLRLLDCKTESCQQGLSGVPVMKDCLCAPCAEHFSVLKTALTALSVPYDEAPRLVRGFDYYTRTVFEVVSDKLGAQNAVAGGGRYDRLVEELGGPSTPAVGFSTGMERVLMACEACGTLSAPVDGPRVFIAVMRSEDIPLALALAAELRKQGVSCLLGGEARSLKSQLRRAGQEGVAFTAILGEEEVRQGTVTLKTMSTGGQQMVPQRDLAGLIRA
jgi:histidyl-tRNA synthetase